MGAPAERIILWVGIPAATLRSPPRGATHVMYTAYGGLRNGRMIPRARYICTNVKVLKPVGAQKNDKMLKRAGPQIDTAGKR